MGFSVESVELIFEIFMADFFLQNLCLKMTDNEKFNFHISINLDLIKRIWYLDHGNEPKTCVRVMIC